MGYSSTSLILRVTVPMFVFRQMEYLDGSLSSSYKQKEKIKYMCHCIINILRVNASA